MLAAPPENNGLSLDTQVKAWKAHLKATKEERSGKPNEPVENAESINVGPRYKLI